MQISSTPTAYGGGEAHRLLSALLRRPASPPGQDLPGAASSDTAAAAPTPPASGPNAAQFASNTLASLLSTQEAPPTSPDVAGAADSNGDGVQGALHRRHAHHAEGNLGSSTNLAARLLGSADSDGDGALSVGEIQGALGSSAASGAGDAQTAAIAKLDTDSDGKLSDAELTAGIDAFRAAHHRGGSGSASQSPPAQAVTA